MPRPVKRYLRRRLRNSTFLACLFFIEIICFHWICHYIVVNGVDFASYLPSALSPFAENNLLTTSSCGVLHKKIHIRNHRFNRYWPLIFFVLLQVNSTTCIARVPWLLLSSEMILPCSVAVAIINGIVGDYKLIRLW